jgi:hypothetical protein
MFVLQDFSAMTLQCAVTNKKIMRPSIGKKLPPLNKIMRPSIGKNYHP